MSHLKLVGSEPVKVRNRRGKHERRPLLSPDEERRFRAAMRNLREAFGTWRCLADAMQADLKTIGAMVRGATAVSGSMIVKVMKASGLSLAELLGGPVPADRCRACGRVRAA